MIRRLGIVFDFGNVVAFFDHMRACRRLAALSSEGLGASDVYERVFESGVEEAYDRGRSSTEEFLRAVRERVGVGPGRASDAELSEAWCDIFWPNEAAERVIRRIKAAGYPLVLASNTNALHYDWFRPRFPVLDLFDELILSHEVRARKPDSAFYARCTESCGLPASSLVYVDDLEVLVRAGEEFGMRAVWYRQATDLAGELRALGVDVPG